MNSLWFILTVILIIFIQSKLYKKYIFKNLAIEREFSNTAIFPGEKTTLILVATNKKIFPVTFLRIQQKFPVELKFVNTSMVEVNDKAKFIHNTVLSMLPFQKVKRRFEIIPFKRGVYNLADNVKIISTDLFGSEEYVKELASPARIVVYPNLIEINDSLIEANSIQGDTFVKRWILEDPIAIERIRDYTNSDRFKDINWKITAKSQKLKVNCYDHTADKKIMILFNLEFHRYIFKTDDFKIFEKAIEIAASLAVMLIRGGIPVGFATNAVCVLDEEYNIVEPGTGEGYVSKLLEIFAAISFFKRYDLSETLNLLSNQLTWGTEVVIVTPFIDDNMIHGLQILKNTAVTVISLSYNEIHNLPENIRLFFFNEEGEEFETV